MNNFEQMFEAAKKFEDSFLMQAYADMCEERGKEGEAFFFRSMSNDLEAFNSISEMKSLFVKLYAGNADYIHTGVPNEWYEMYLSLQKAANEQQQELAL